MADCWNCGACVDDCVFCPSCGSRANLEQELILYYFSRGYKYKKYCFTFIEKTRNLYV